MHQKPFDPPPQLLDPMYLYLFLIYFEGYKKYGHVTLNFTNPFEL